jgi:hypothetical protein
MEEIKRRKKENSIISRVSTHSMCGNILEGRHSAESYKKFIREILGTSTTAAQSSLSARSRGIVTCQTTVCGETHWAVAIKGG